jgi:hypothetical protein
MQPMKALRGRPVPQPEPVAGATRLRIIRAKLRQLSRMTGIAEYVNDYLLFILLINTSVLLQVVNNYMEFQYGPNTPLARALVSPIIRTALVVVDLMHENKLMALAIFIGPFIALYLLQICAGAMAGRREGPRLKMALERSGLAVNITAGWDAIPDVYDYTHKAFMSFVCWPFASNAISALLFAAGKEYEESQVVRVVQNLDWYTAPPVRLWRKLWLVRYSGFIGGLLSLIACLAIFIAYAVQVSAALKGVVQAAHAPVWSYLLHTALLGYLLLLLSGLVCAMLSRSAVSLRARILLDAMQPAFADLGPERTGS